MIDDNGNARLTDFGLTSISETIENITTAKQTTGGSPGYMAPELFHEGSIPSRKSDIFAFGMTIVEVYTGKWPFADGNFTNAIQVALAVLGGRRPVRPSAVNFTDQLWALTQKCWNAEPDKRPKIAEVLIIVSAFKP